MQAKISKTLEGLIARTAFETSKLALTHSLQDYLILEILQEEGSLAHQILSSHLKGWELHQIRLRIELEIEAAAGHEEQNPEEFFTRYTEELRRLFAPMRSVSTAHVLLHAASNPHTFTSQVLGMYHINAQSIALEIEKFAAEGDPRPSPEVHGFNPNDINREASRSEPKLLDKFGTDLTRQAREGRIDPVVGREREIERVVQILSRRKKNNPILIGEAGVGKSAIVEGLALRIAADQVPGTISGKNLYSLDVSSLVAGTKFRGEFEERMQQLIDELRKNQDSIIFIDEIHTIAGAGSTQGSLDTANILKPALARGELQLIGATTLNEYREDIESDSALERRFQKVLVEPTSADETVQILRNIAPNYESHHKVRYTDEALLACVALTERYITDRHFPDKAIDVMDEAGARIHLCGDTSFNLSFGREPQVSSPEPVEAVAGGKAPKSRAKKTAASNKTAVGRTTDSGIAVGPGWNPTNATVPPEIRPEHIEQVITAITGIPVERISVGENERLRGLRDYLAERVIGQGEAVEKISRSIQRSRTGLKDEGRPTGVFLFVGPTGVGKTLLAKELSKWLFDQNKGLIRIDMSEYGEKHNVARLIGAPPGYIGYGEGGQLTEAVRRHPYAVVLLDEIEKAHPEVCNTLLQVFDEGHLTDGAGRKVDFRNTVIILTSNIGSRAVAARTTQVGYSTLSKSDTEQKTPHTEYRKALEETFAPEFLNRIDDIVSFRTLDLSDVKRIIDLELRGLLARTDRLGYRIEITDRAKQTLATIGYEQKYGVRALRRTLTDRIEEPLSGLIIDGKLSSGGRVVIEPDGENEVILRVA